MQRWLAQHSKKILGWTSSSGLSVLVCLFSLCALVSSHFLPQSKDAVNGAEESGWNNSLYLKLDLFACSICKCCWKPFWYWVITNIFYEYVCMYVCNYNWNCLIELNFLAFSWIFLNFLETLSSKQRKKVSYVCVDVRELILNIPTVFVTWVYVLLKASSWYSF